MISDITLGQFFPGFSVIHKLDPRTKIVLAILFIVSISNIRCVLLLYCILYWLLIAWPVQKEEL